jgi:hypothetical protein
VCRKIKEQVNIDKYSQLSFFYSLFSSVIQVSWVRKGDGHLLAVGDDTFINDGRFQAQRIASSDTWTLQIRSVQLSDAGDYECQVSSNEPKISRIVHLRAVGKWNHFSCTVYHLFTF